LIIFGNLNTEQQNAYDAIMEIIDKDFGKQVFVDGYDTNGRQSQHNCALKTK
jgi:hypothetical protein